MELPEQSPEIDKIAEALAKAQGAFPRLTTNEEAKVQGKDGRAGYSYSYADLSAVIEAIKKPLAEAGISYTQALLPNGTGILLKTKLMHSSGQWLASYYPLPTGQSPQVFGSFLTYARRYSLVALLGVAAASDDDDGAKAEESHRTRPPQNGNPPPRPQRSEYQQNGNGHAQNGANGQHTNGTATTQSAPATPPKSVEKAKAEIAELKTRDAIKEWKEANAVWLERLERLSQTKFDDVMAYIDEHYQFAS